MSDAIRRVWNSPDQQESRRKKALTDIDFLAGRTTAYEAVLRGMRERVELLGISDDLFWALDLAVHYASEIDKVCSGVNTLPDLKRFWKRVKREAKR